MNQSSPSSSSISASVAPDAVSRRAYELWESEGRPEGCDMRHWLQAEQELQTSSSNPPMPARNSDVTPLQGTRAAAAVSANREMKRPPGATTPPMPEKNGGSAGARKKPTNAPAL